MTESKDANEVHERLEREIAELRGLSLATGVLGRALPVFLPLCLLALPVLARCRPVLLATALQIFSGARARRLQLLLLRLPTTLPL